MVAPAVRSTNRQVSGEQDHSTMSRGVMTRRSQGAMALVSEWSDQLGSSTDADWHILKHLQTTSDADMGQGMAKWRYDIRIYQV